jgi:ABC-type bacteriocin/lantibiotic exporter with double-glycine peptidase domain
MYQMPGNVYAYLFKYSSRQQFIVIALTLSLLPLAPVPLELQRRILDDAVANKDVDLLIWLGALYLGSLLLAALLKFAMQVQRELISAGIVFSLRKSVYRCFYTILPKNKRTTPPDTDYVNEGAVVSMLSSEVEKLGAFSGTAISGPLLQLGTLVVVLGYMFWVEPQVAVIAIALYSPKFFIVPYLQSKMNRLAMHKALEVRKLTGFIVDNPEDELLGETVPKEYISIADRILELRKSFVFTKHIMKTINNILIAFGPLSVVCYGGYLVIDGEMAIGVILAFVTGLERLAGPVRELINSYSEITDAHMRYNMLINTFPTDHAKQ